MFTYSHANTTLGQSQRAYYVGYSHWLGSAGLRVGLPWRCDS